MRMRLGWLLGAALALGACTGPKEDEPRDVTMRIGHAAPLSGTQTVLQVIAADAAAEEATVGVRCEGTTEEVRVTKAPPQTRTCGLGLQLVEVLSDERATSPRALRLRVYPEGAPLPQATTEESDE